MKKTVITILTVILITGILSFVGLFGLEIGPLYIAPVNEGITLGLDLVGGSEIVYEAEVPAGMSASELSAGMDTAQTMLRQRLNNLGYTEANVYISGDRSLVVDIPSVDKPEEAVQMLGTTAVVQFKDADGNVVLEGGDISSATAQYGQIDEFSAPTHFVALKLSDEGRQKFKAATAEIAAIPDSSKRVINIVLDGEIISSPMVSEEYAGTGLDTDTPIITLGSDATVEYAKYLAEIISAGQLPFALINTKLQAVGATLGERSLETGIIAGIIGVLLVMTYMIIVYRIPGIVADFALILYIALFLVIMSITKINLSLPGIAGIILTIGMAVDANVIIFERLREELRSGKTLRAAVDSGFRRAFTAILDSNVTTVIAGLVLLIQGTGTILGFAKTLLIGVILSMACMLIVPNLILRSLASLRFKSLKSFGA